MTIDPSTLTPYAAAAGVWLWESYGKDFVKWLGSSTWKKLKGKGGDLTEKWVQFKDWKTAAENYRHEMLRQYNSMRILGMAEPTPLEGIFTDAYLLDKPSAWRRYNIDELEKNADLGGRNSNQEEDPRQDGMMLLKQKQRLFILGKPGAGKTTFLKYLAVQAAQGQLDKVSIFVSLKDWSDDNIDLISFLVKQFRICNFPDAESFIGFLLESGKALVLFDGLDEVNLEKGKRDQITRAIKDFANEYGKAQCIVTCRVAASDYQFEHFSYVELADFSPEQTKLFVQKWFRNDLTKREKFVEAFDEEENKGIRDLARTPLLLTLLCLAFDETMTFPLRRVEIYEEALDALLKKWDSSRSIQRDEVYRKLSLVRKRQMLARIAAETFQDGKLFMRRDDITKKIETFLQTLPPGDGEEAPDGATVLRAMEAQHGLLIERAQGVYSFSHLTFHEYFVAKHVADNPVDWKIAGMVVHADDARWREVLLLTSSLLDNENADAFFGAFQKIWQQKLADHAQLSELFRWMTRKLIHIEHHRVFYIQCAYILFGLQHHQPHNSDRILINFQHLSIALNRGAEISLMPKFMPNTEFVDLQILSTMLHYAQSLALHSAEVKNTHEKTLYLDLLPAYFSLVVLRVASRRQFRDTVVTRIGLQKHHSEMLAILANDANLHTFRSALVGLTMPAPDASDTLWQDYAEHFRNTLIQHRDIGHEWNFSESDEKFLESYLTANLRLVECLELAAVTDRAGIKSRLLLPPEV